MDLTVEIFTGLQKTRSLKLDIRKERFYKANLIFVTCLGSSQGDQKNGNRCAKNLTKQMVSEFSESHNILDKGGDSI